jgi:hypothetical protein
MKYRTLLAAVAIATIATAPGHEAVTIGPNGGRILYVDSSTTPNVEVLVNKEGRAEIQLLDKDRKPIESGTQSIEVTGGPRSSAKKLLVEKQGSKFVTEKVPDGAPYFLIVQLKESEKAKPVTLRLNYNPKPAASGKPDYLDDSVNASSGDNIEVPATASGVWAEINQHQKELEDGIAAKKYEALDEVTRAYPKLAKGLVGKGGDKEAEVGPLVETLVKQLGTIREANASRQLDKAKPVIAELKTTLASLKKLFPANVANASLGKE